MGKNQVMTAARKNKNDDYNDIMGVPITFLNKYNPNQFELIGVANHGKDNKYDLFPPKVNGKDIYTRILIKRKFIS
jgi:hypothetical protein